MSDDKPITTDEITEARRLIAEAMAPGHECQRCADCVEAEMARDQWWRSFGPRLLDAYEVLKRQLDDVLVREVEAADEQAAQRATLVKRAEAAERALANRDAEWDARWDAHCKLRHMDADALARRVEAAERGMRKLCEEREAALKCKEELYVQTELRNQENRQRAEAAERERDRLKEIADLSQKRYEEETTKHNATIAAAKVEIEEYATEHNIATSHMLIAQKALAERDEARRWLRYLWRGGRVRSHDCPEANGIRLALGEKP